MSDLKVAFWLALDYADDLVLRHRWYRVCRFVGERLYNAEQAAAGRPERIVNGTWVEG